MLTRHIHAFFLLTSVSMLCATGCAVGTEAEEALPTDLTVTEQEALVPSTCETVAANAQIEAFYGARPKRYLQYLIGDNEAQRRLLAVVPDIAAHLNRVAASKGYPFRFDEAEILANFLTEGGLHVVKYGITEINGFSNLGMDNVMVDIATIEPWLTPEASAVVHDPSKLVPYVNEAGQQIYSLIDLPLEEGVYAQAAYFAARKKIFADDVRAQKKRYPTNKSVEFYWNTIYYNGGIGNGRRYLQRYGLGLATTRWKKADDYALYYRSIQYNATWRTSTYDSISKLGFGCGQVRTGAL